MEGELAVAGEKKMAYLFNDALLLCEITGSTKANDRKLTAYRMIPLSLAVVTDLPPSEREFDSLSASKHSQLEQNSSINSIWWRLGRTESFSPSPPS